MLKRKKEIIASVKVNNSIVKIELFDDERKIINVISERLMTAYLLSSASFSKLV